MPIWHEKRKKSKKKSIITKIFVQRPRKVVKSVHHRKGVKSIRDKFNELLSLKRTSYTTIGLSEFAISLYEWCTKLTKAFVFYVRNS